MREGTWTLKTQFLRLLRMPIPSLAYLVAEPGIEPEPTSLWDSSVTFTFCHLVSPAGFEPATPSLKVMCSANWAIEIFGAGTQIRTENFWLEDRHVSHWRHTRILVIQLGFEPRSFHFVRVTLYHWVTERLEASVGLEPTTKEVETQYSESTELRGYLATIQRIKLWLKDLESFVLSLH